MSTKKFQIGRSQTASLTQFDGGKSKLGACSGLALAIAMGGAGTAAAQTATPAAQTNDVVVITANAVPIEYEKLGIAVTVLDGERLKESGYNYVSDALRQVPGLAISRTGPFGGVTAVRTRGSEGNHTVILFNGVDVSDPGSGETDLSRLLTSEVEKIEVLRGPQSGLYGSNALAGVVNIISRKNIDGYYATGSAEYGSFATTELKAGMGMGNGKDYITVSLDSLDTDGFDSSPPSTAFPVNQYTNDKEGYNNRSTAVMAGWQALDILRFDAFIRDVEGYGDTDGFDFSGTPGRQGRTFDDNSFNDTQNTNYSVVGTLELLDGKSTTKAGWSRTNNFVRTSFPTRGNREKMTLQSSFSFGADGFESTVTGFAENKEEYYRSSSGARTREQTSFGLQYFAAIANQVYVTATARRDDNDTFKDFDTYAISGSWIIPNTGTRPHLSYGVGYTNPTFFEQFGSSATFRGNPNLVPEQAKGLDIGVEQTLLDGRLILDLTYFSADLKKEITTSGCPTIPNPAPPPAAFTTACNSGLGGTREGYELSARYSPFDALSLIGSYTNLKATEGAANLVEVRRPEHQGSLDAYWDVIPNLKLNAGVTYTGDFLDNSFLGGFTAVRAPVDGYTIARIGASYQLSNNVEAYARVENAFDTDYEEVIGYATPGRAAYVGIRFKAGPAAK